MPRLDKHRIRWRNLLSPEKVWQALVVEALATHMLCRHGTPTTILHFLGGFGDELAMTCVAREMKKRNPRDRLWQISKAAPLLRGNPDYSVVLDEGSGMLFTSNLLERWRLRLHYATREMPADFWVPPPEHILAALCRSAGLEGTVELRPYCYLSDEERAAGRIGDFQICIQSVGEKTYENYIGNRCWYHERLQEVVDTVRQRWPSCRLVQLGIAADPPLQGVVDCRGKTTLRQSAALLSQSSCFVGTPGFLSHLARAVDCRSVIVHGGREHSWQTGYVCNENLDVQLPCAPCWLYNDCEFDRECMRSISAADVVAALERAVGRQGTPLEVQKVDLRKEVTPPNSRCFLAKPVAIS